MIDTETIVNGDLFIGDSTYIKGEWVRRRDYEALDAIAVERAQQVGRLTEELERLLTRLREMQPPVIDAIVERRDNLLIVRCVESVNWGPRGVHVVISPERKSP